MVSVEAEVGQWLHASKRPAPDHPQPTKELIFAPMNLCVILNTYLFPIEVFLEHTKESFIGLSKHCEFLPPSSRFDNLTFRLFL